MNYNKYIIASAFLLVSAGAFSQNKKDVEKSGNPIFPGWYADPKRTFLIILIGYIQLILMTMKT